MKCIDCGDDAVLLADLGQFLLFAFCKKCAKKRIKPKLPYFGKQMDIDDLFEDLLPKD